MTAETGSSFCEFSEQGAEQRLGQSLAMSSYLPASGPAYIIKQLCSTVADSLVKLDSSCFGEATLSQHLCLGFSTAKSETKRLLDTLHECRYCMMVSNCL